MPAMIAYRAAVDPSDCDFLGHMNVSRYFVACSDGVFALQSEIGLTASDMRQGRRLSFAVVHAESDFRAELMAGDAIRLEIEVLSLGGKSIKFRHRLYRCEDDRLAFESVFTSVMFDLVARKAVPIPDEVREKARAFMAEGL